MGKYSARDSIIQFIIKCIPIDEKSTKTPITWQKNAEDVIISHKIGRTSVQLNAIKGSSCSITYEELR
jgi:hypothetical protein